MRFVMKVSFPPEKFNQAVRDGSIGGKMQRILEDLQPEAVYFSAEQGRRGGIYIIHMDSASEIPRYAEPFFLYFDAKVEFHPTMSAEDLAAAGLEELGQKWG